MKTKIASGIVCASAGAFSVYGFLEEISYPRHSSLTGMLILIFVITALLSVAGLISAFSKDS